MYARTERLLLRPGYLEDAAALAQAIGDPLVARHLGRVPLPYGEADARDWLSQAGDPTDMRFVIMARTRGSLRLVGGIGVHWRDDDGGFGDGRGHHELGYWIARPYWGLGFATEAGRAVLEIARAVGLPPLRAGHFVDNAASGAVLRKLGFRATGRTAPRVSVARGETVACALYEESDVAELMPSGVVRPRFQPDLREEWRLQAA